MDALVMCGGRGTRLDADCEKPLFAVGGRPMIGRVADALAESRVETVHAVVSPHTPETRRFAEEYESLSTIETPGDGYVEDLRVALEAVESSESDDSSESSDLSESPVLTVAADLPLLEADAIDSVLDAYTDGSLTVCVPASLKRALGASADTTFEHDGRELAPTGVNVVADTDTETMYETYDARFAVNVNRLSDADLAEALL